MKVFLRIFLGAVYVALIVLLLLQGCKGCDKPHNLSEATIRVIDDDTEEPLEGVKVEITSDDPACEHERLRTDRRGECHFDYSDPTNTLNTVIVTQPGYRQRTVEDIELEYFEDNVLVIRIKHLTDQEIAIDISPELGKLKVTLLWTNQEADLDLHVMQPNGNEIYWDNDHDRRTSGKLDFDWNPNNSNSFSRPTAENILWTNPPRGDYEVKVKYYATHNDEEPKPATCRVIIFENGVMTQQFDNITLNAPQDTEFVTTVRVP